MKEIITAVLILAATTVELMADGKMFWREQIPPKIPYQRALILHRDGTETLVLQSRYEIPKTGERTTVGWVVPVPAVPEIASMPADVARGLFRYLSMVSRPRLTRIGPIVFGAVFLGVGGLSLITLLLCLVSFVVPMPVWFKQNRGKLARYSMWGLFLCCLVMVFPSLAGASASLGVDMIAEQRVGIYDVRVVRSDDADALISWLNAHEFRFDDQDTAAFDSYVSQGWCFVVAVINPSNDQREQDIVAEGLAAPLILRFPIANPVYPVALTGTGGYETEILIYLASATKMICRERLTLRFAGPMHERNLERVLAGTTEPANFFDPKGMDYPYLCKFKDRLTPAQMNRDIVFALDEDEAPYREHIVKW
jgi:hypothetical protein